MYINNIYLFKTFLAFCPFWVTWLSPWGYIFHSLPLSRDFTVTSKTSRLISLGREHVKPNVHYNLELASRISFDLEVLWSKSRPACEKGSALSQEPRIHYFEKAIQTSYFGTDFPLNNDSNLSFISLSYIDYKWNSCTIQQLATVFPYFQRTQIF